VYGLDWGGGVYVNYAFLGVWALDLWRWRAEAHRGATRSRWGTWLARAFYFFIVILNGAVIFAAGWRRWLGVVLIVWLAAAWWPRRSRGGVLRA